MGWPDAGDAQPETDIPGSRVRAQSGLGGSEKPALKEREKKKRRREEKRRQKRVGRRNRQSLATCSFFLEALINQHGLPIKPGTAAIKRKKERERLESKTLFAGGVAGLVSEGRKLKPSGERGKKPTLSHSLLVFVVCLC